MSFAEAVAAARRAAEARPAAPPALADLTRAVLGQAVAAHDAAPPLTLPRYLGLVERWRPDAAAAPLEPLLARAAPEHPDFVAYLRLAAESLVDVLRGDASPLEPYLAADAPRFLYERAPIARWMNGVLAAAAAALRGPYLEVGAGSGGTTAAVLAALPADARYDATDASTTFFPRLAKRLGARPGLRFSRLDLEAPPAGAAAYATVLAANVLHATRDLRATLATVRDLVQPGGSLLVWEATRAEPWFAFTFATIDGWRRHADGLRADGPLVDAAGWLRLLAAAGFADAVAIPDDDALGQRVLMARRP